MYARHEREGLDTRSDADLLRLAKDGYPAALTILMARHSEALFRYCCTLTPNRHDAEDICQEAMARAIGRIESLESGDSFRAWLFRVARNLSVDWHRRGRRLQPMPDDGGASFPSPDIGPHEHVETSEEHEMIAQALRTLKQRHQEVLVLREVEGLSYADIANRLNVSQSAVETLLFRARRRLKEQYGKAAFARLAFLAPVRAVVLRLAAPLAAGPPVAVKLAAVAALAGASAVTIGHVAVIHPLHHRVMASHAHILMATFPSPMNHSAVEPSRPLTRRTISPRHAVARHSPPRVRPRAHAPLTRSVPHQLVSRMRSGIHPVRQNDRHPTRSGKTARFVASHATQKNLASSLSAARAGTARAPLKSVKIRHPGTGASPAPGAAAYPNPHPTQGKRPIHWSGHSPTASRVPQHVDAPVAQSPPKASTGHHAGRQRFVVSGAAAGSLPLTLPGHSTAVDPGGGHAGTAHPGGIHPNPAHSRSRARAMPVASLAQSTQAASAPQTIETPSPQPVAIATRPSGSAGRSASTGSSASSQQGPTAAAGGQMGQPQGQAAGQNPTPSGGKSQGQSEPPTPAPTGPKIKKP